MERLNNHLTVCLMFNHGRFIFLANIQIIKRLFV